MIDQGKNFIFARPNHVHAKVLNEVTILEEGAKSAHVVFFFFSLKSNYILECPLECYIKILRLFCCIFGLYVQ